MTRVFRELPIVIVGTVIVVVSVFGLVLGFVYFGLVGWSIFSIFSNPLKYFNLIWELAEGTLGHIKSGYFLEAGAGILMLVSFLFVGVLIALLAISLLLAPFIYLFRRLKTRRADSHKTL